MTDDTSTSVDSSASSDAADGSVKPPAPHVVLGRAVATLKRAEKKIAALALKESTLKAKLASVRQERADNEAAQDEAQKAKAAALKDLE